MRNLERVFRQEHKYLLTLQEAAALDHRLSTTVAADRHNDQNGYAVRSLYFDTLFDRDFHEKNDGLCLRRKLRLRIYNPDDTQAKLEMKQKQGSDQLKRSLAVSRDDAQRIAQGCYTPLLQYSEPFAAECFSVFNTFCYRPKTIIQYDRVAYLVRENNTRITFDRNIAATESCYDLFSGKLNLYPVLDPYLVVMEVKYDGFLLSYLKDLIQPANRSRLSASKYCMGRGASLGYLF